MSKRSGKLEAPRPLLVLILQVHMSNAYLPAGTNGSYGTATVRAREQGCNSDEAAREQRIAELRRQYLQGTYQIDAQELSTAMIKRHLAKNS
jgi:Anti-sigma-28 factor, FlgM